MKININTINTYIITLNLITFISLLNMTYIFVRNIASDFTLIQLKGSIIKGVEFNKLAFEIHTDSGVVSQFCHPIILIFIGITLNTIYFIIKRLTKGD
ncbi:hypothetical protein AMS62_20595 [Bacillus sp. FJAT-18019]|nr:hypothetical protein AMS62_20595 [Bacillus sp. FJAT-18019]